MRPYDVPFYSQHFAISDEHWKLKGCGIVALKSVLEYWHSVSSNNQTDAAEHLLKKGLALDAYLEGVGWKHRGLAELAKAYGYHAKNYDLWNEEADIVFGRLSDELAAGPVIVSVWNRFIPLNGGGHLAVCTGVGDGAVYITDPDETAAEYGVKELTHQDFLRGFKKRYIVIRPHN